MKPAALALLFALFALIPAARAERFDYQLEPRQIADGHIVVAYMRGDDVGRERDQRFGHIVFWGFHDYVSPVEASATRLFDSAISRLYP